MRTIPGTEALSPFYIDPSYSSGYIPKIIHKPLPSRKNAVKVGMNQDEISSMVKRKKTFDL